MAESEDMIMCVGYNETLGQMESRQNNEASLRSIAQSLNQLVEIEYERNLLLKEFLKVGKSDDGKN